MEYSSKRRWYQDQPRSVAFVYSLQKIISSRNTADSEKSKKGSFPTHKFPLFRPAREIAEHKKVSPVIYGNFFRLLLCSLSCFRNFRGKGKKALKLLFWEGFGKCKGNYCSYRSGSKCQEHTLSQTPQLAGNLLLCREKVRENEFNAPPRRRGRGGCRPIRRLVPPLSPYLYSQMVALFKVCFLLFFLLNCSPCSDGNGWLRAGAAWPGNNSHIHTLKLVTS